MFYIIAIVDTVLRLASAQLITHVAPLEQAASLFELLDQRPEEVIQAVISF